MRTPFVLDDLQTLSKHYSVSERIGSGSFHLLKIIFDVFQTDILFCWFASVYSAIAVLIGKRLGVKSIIVIGGVDMAAEADLGYGLWLSRWKASLVKRALRSADCILAVDTSLKEEAKQRARYDGNNIHYFPTGYDGLLWRPLGEKRDFVLTVANAPDLTRLRIKGIDVLIKAAEKMPTTEFLIVGCDPNLAYTLSPPLNMKFLPAVSQEQLIHYYRQAKVYCQPSRREGLSNALCEAMLCGCIPVATNVGGSATAIGDSGFIVPYNDVEALTSALKSAIETDEDLSTKARARIVGLFPKERREIELLKIIERLQDETTH